MLKFDYTYLHTKESGMFAITFCLRLIPFFLNWKIGNKQRWCKAFGRDLLPMEQLWIKRQSIQNKYTRI